MDTLTVYDPTLPRTPKPFALAPRPQNMEGLRLGLVDNTKHNAAALLSDLAAALIETAGAGSFRMWQKHSATHPIRPELIEEVANGCDVVICGVGD